MKSLLWLAGILAFITSATVLTGCAKDGVERKQTDNERFEVTKLFTNEGCSLYRFLDTGYYRYYTNCRGSVEWRQQHGKTTSPEGVSGN